MGVRKRVDSKTWEILYYYKGERRRETGGRSKREAEAKLAKRKAEIFEGKYFDIKNSKRVRFTTFCETFYNTHVRLKSANYIALYGYLTIPLKRFFSDYYMDDITTKHIAEYRAMRLSEKAKDKLTNVSPSTVNREIELLRSMFNRAVEWGDALKNPVKNDLITSEKDFQRTRYLTNDEAKKIYDLLDGHLKPVVVVTINAGLRLRETLNLRWRDCDFEHRLINIIKSKTGKRLLPMNDIVYNTLLSWPKYEKSEYIFCHKEGKKEGQPFNDVRTAWRNVLKKAEIEDFRFHDLRHTFASYLLMLGSDLKTVSELLGHASTRMTERYTHLTKAHKQRGVERFGEKFAFGTATKTATCNKLTVDKFLEESQQTDTKEVVSRGVAQTG